MQTDEAVVIAKSKIEPTPPIPREADDAVLFFSTDATPPGRVYKYAWITQYMANLELGGEAIQLTFINNKVASSAKEGVKLAWTAIYNYTWKIEYKTRKQHPGDPDHPETDLFIWRVA